MPANVETMFYVKEKPWHGLGTQVHEAPTSEEALRVSGLDWRVTQEPVYVLGKKVPNSVANVRSNDERVLGIVTPDYKIVQNNEAFSFTDNLLGEGVTYETAGSLAKGKRVWLLARMPETIVLGDKTEPYLVFTNSHDGKGSIRVAITPIRVVCQNTLNMALRQANRSWSAVHTGDMNKKLETAHTTLELAHTYMNELNLEAEKLAVVKMSQKKIDQFVTELFPISEKDGDRKVENIKELRESFLTALNQEDVANFRNTAWGVMNAVADMTTHLQPRRNTDTFRENKFAQLIGGHYFLDKAYEIIKAA